MSGRRPRSTCATRITVGALALGVLGAACGSGAAGPTVAGTVPPRPTTIAPGAGTEVAGPTTDVTLYFVRGGGLVAATRALPKVVRIGAEAVTALLGGPTDAERSAGLTTAIPAGARFNDLAIDGGVARVDLSQSFQVGGSGLDLTLRLAQVTCTLSAFPTVTGVRFAFDGNAVAVTDGSGVVVDRPVTCEGYQHALGG